MKELEIKVIGEVKENSVLVLREDISSDMEVTLEMLSAKVKELPKGAIIIISDEEPLLFDEKEMNSRGWFKQNGVC